MNYDKSWIVHKPDIGSFYIKAAAFVLKMKPELNIRMNDKEKVMKEHIDITIVIRHLKV